MIFVESRYTSMHHNHLRQTIAPVLEVRAARSAGSTHKSATMTASWVLYWIRPTAHLQQTPVSMDEGVHRALVRWLSVSPLRVPSLPCNGRQYPDHYRTTGQCTGRTRADLSSPHGRATGCHLAGVSQSDGLAPDPARRRTRGLGCHFCRAPGS